MIDVSDYMDRQFAEKGRGPKYDCWGLVLAVLENEYGITGLPDFRKSYRHTGDYKAISECVEDESHNWIKIEQPEEGAVIVFSVGGYPQHVGICTGYQKGHPMFLHVHKGANSTHERLTSSIWAERIKGIFRYD